MKFYELLQNIMPITSFGGRRYGFDDPHSYGYSLFDVLTGYVYLIGFVIIGYFCLGLLNILPNWVGQIILVLTLATFAGALLFSAYGFFNDGSWVEAGLLALWGGYCMKITVERLM